MNKQELKPCPFCGGEAKIQHRENEIYVQCQHCLAELRYFDTIEQAIKAWNTRPTQVSDEERLSGQGNLSCSNCGFNKPNNAICGFCYNFNKHSELPKKKLVHSKSIKPPSNQKK